MTRRRLAIALVLAPLLSAGGWASAGAVEAPPPRPEATAAGGGVRVAALVEPEADAARFCTADGTRCIGSASYVADVCRLLQSEAAANGLDPGFFARLIWRESLFAADAVSPVGAQGIAQFMPGTAALRGLADPFNPAEALAASASYLADLVRGYGNVGLAAVAYNGGEARADRFVAAAGGLPEETRAYVVAITGQAAETWRDAPPAAVDLALGGGDFQADCVARAAARDLPGLDDRPHLLPWGVILASHRDRAGAERQVGRLRNRFAAVLGAETVSYTRDRAPGVPRRLYLAQVGRDTRDEADALCARLEATGGDCMVLRNGP